ncbi:hypothetical protein VTJ49DRAFT_2748 [Mycothermus thermophilus]|uniref:Uncharacterized protein n=1 Tax=Humicola insolens TaxID=85995 RepID=A0ABR3VNH6_HUMIN
MTTTIRTATTTAVMAMTEQTMAKSEVMGLPKGLRKRFYEPVLLLDALRYVYRKDNRLSEPDLESGVGRSNRETYFCFLNKLCQICDSRSKQALGGTVSAITVLDSGTIEYRLASNQRNSAELETVKEYLTEILSVLGRATDDKVTDRAARAPIASGILRRILAFNRPRIEDYLESLVRDDRLDFCIKYALSDGTAQGRATAEALEELRPHFDAARRASPVDHDQFARHVESLLQTIDTHYENALDEYMKRFSDPDSPWRELRHAIGRLLSYFIAVRVLFTARKLWPLLFVDFKVATVPSSMPLEQPRDYRRTANKIITRMTCNKTEVETFQRHAASLQKHGLDKHISQQADPDRFRPIVHAEVLLLDSVLRSRLAADRDGDGPLRFFGEAEFGRYIASSKPTCLLCHAYFTVHPEGVLCRPSHGNLYYNWRAPDLHPDDAEGAVKEREDILEKMVKIVRAETFRAIRERSYTRSRHDSRDTPSDPLGSTALTESLVGDGGSVLAAQVGVSQNGRRMAYAGSRHDPRGTPSEPLGGIALSESSILAAQVASVSQGGRRAGYGGVMGWKAQSDLDTASV